MGEANVARSPISGILTRIENAQIRQPREGGRLLFSNLIRYTPYDITHGMKYLLLLLLLSTNAQALTIRYGLGVLTKRTPSEVKTVSLSKESEIASNICAKIEAGHWWDKVYSNSFYGSTSFGIRVQPWIFDVRLYSGIAGITKTDAMLGGHFQFQNDLSISLHAGKASIGVAFTHLSSAGIYPVNRGRNFGTMNVSYGF